MRILFIGGTRFIGLSAVQQLRQQGHTVAVFHRGQTQAELPDGVAEIHGDMRQLEHFTADFKQFAPDVIVHTMLVWESDGEQLMQVSKGLARRVVGISSCDVYLAYGRLIGSEPGAPVPVPVAEDGALREKWYPYRGLVTDDPQHRLYNYDKIPIERRVMSDPDLPGTILRLPMVYGPRDYQRRIYGYLKRMDDHRPAILLPQELYHWRDSRGYVADVGAAIALATVDDRATGRIYNVAEPDSLTEAEWIRAIADVAGWQGEIVTVEREKLPGADGVNGQDLTIDTTRIRAELGFQEAITRAEALRHTVEWDRAYPPEQFADVFDYAAEDKILQEIGFGD